MHHVILIYFLSNSLNQDVLYALPHSLVSSLNIGINQAKPVKIDN